MNAAEDDFAAAVAPLRAPLRLHCYRLLGSSHDSDDMVQETLLRAWRARETLADPARLKPWLYRIATNACLDELARRPRRGLASDLYPAAADYPPRSPVDEPVWLEPMPDAWIAGAGADPAARYTLRESVALAFVAALQVLSPAQRAVLLLRDVVGLSADEAAEALEQSVAATHSALHRARATIDEKVARRDPSAFASHAAASRDDDVLARYVRAVGESDLDAMIALIHEDMHTTMPPSPTWVRGRADNERFYRAMFGNFRRGSVHVEPLGANGQPGFAFFRDGEVRAIEVLEVADGAILRLHHFMQPAIRPLFAR